MPAQFASYWTGLKSTPEEVVSLIHFAFDAHDTYHLLTVFPLRSTGGKGSKDSSS